MLKVFLFKSCLTQLKFKIIACQNVTKALIDYTKTFKEPTSLIDYLKIFPIENLCSKANLITFRSLPDGIFLALIRLVLKLKL